MVNITVYGDKDTLSTKSVLILLEELELEYKLHDVDLIKEQHKDSKFLELNPFGQVPVVKYGERILFESRAILRYIAGNNYDDIDLRGNVNSDIWLEVESHHFSPKIKVQDIKLEELRPVLEIYNDRLSIYKYIGGNDYSIADVSHISYLHALVKEYKDYVKEYPLVYRWYKRLMNRKYIQRIML